MLFINPIFQKSDNLNKSYTNSTENLLFLAFLNTSKKSNHILIYSRILLFYSTLFYFVLHKVEEEKRRTKMPSEKQGNL